jgi:hypothetical protein
MSNCRSDGVTSVREDGTHVVKRVVLQAMWASTAHTKSVLFLKFLPAWSSELRHKDDDTAITPHGHMDVVGFASACHYCHFPISIRVK